jgi:predicted nucleic acid-binding protein
MAKCYKSGEIQYLINRLIFFDANVLMYIFWPTGLHKWESDYSSIFNKLLKQKNKMFVDFIVISEVINRSIKTEYEKYLQEKNISRNDMRFKNFRDSKDGQEALSDIYLVVSKNIVNKFNIAGKAFSKSDIESFIQADHLDFSDKGIIALCKEEGFVLLTNDRDFTDIDIDILTSNPVLFR